MRWGRVPYGNVLNSGHVGPSACPHPAKLRASVVSAPLQLPSLALSPPLPLPLPSHSDVGSASARRPPPSSLLPPALRRCRFHFRPRHNIGELYKLPSLPPPSASARCCRSASRQTLSLPLAVRFALVCVCVCVWHRCGQHFPIRLPVMGLSCIGTGNGRGETARMRWPLARVRQARLATPLPPPPSVPAVAPRRPVVHPLPSLPPCVSGLTSAQLLPRPYNAS